MDASKPTASVQTEIPVPQIAIRNSNQFSLENPNNKAGEATIGTGMFCVARSYILLVQNMFCRRSIRLSTGVDKGLCGQ